MNEFIAGKTTIYFYQKQQNVDVLFSRYGCRFYLIFNELSEKTISAKEYLFGREFNAIFINEEGQQYRSYGCLCRKSTLTLEHITLEGEYKTLTKGTYIPNCGILDFHFNGIEDCFINCKEITGCLPQEYSKWTMIEANGKRKIAVRLKDVNDFETIQSILIRAREYFEFILDHELTIDEINYKDINDKGIEIIRDDKISSEKSAGFYDRTNLTMDILFNDLNKWLIHYEKYKEPIYMEKSYL